VGGPTLRLTTCRQGGKPHCTCNCKHFVCVGMCVWGGGAGGFVLTGGMQWEALLLLAWRLGVALHSSLPKVNPLSPTISPAHPPNYHTPLCHGPCFVTLAILV
jgi:hypothetical protein